MQDAFDAIEFSAASPLDDLFLSRLWRAVRAGSGMATRMIEDESGITHREWGMIGMLAQVGEVTSSGLAEHLHLDRVSTSRALRSLFEKKLVERRQDAEDGREVRVRLSSAGHQLFEELFPRVAGLNVELLEGMDAADLEVLLQCLHRLEMRGSELNAQGAVPEKANRHAGGTRHHWPRQSFERTGPMGLSAAAGQ
ncbi:MarR family winged helix-turn-helix transcriptional regulator [Variovorax boronicumulans]|uniref:MarR family winged helix-turn-helix transcriptional regulator n=1 Tax=Variovorax boronicumulans TaxID=436515 RepID=UPI0033964EE4